MTGATDLAELDREARALTRYLIGRAPSDYHLACYRRGRSRQGPADARIDRVLLKAAGAGRVAARIADGYARVARPTGGFRRRVTLMVAILENAPDSHLRLTEALVGPIPLIVARVVIGLAASAAAMALGMIVFGPIDLGLGRGPTT